MPDPTYRRPLVRGAPLTRSGDDLRPLYSWRSAICDSDLSPTSRHVALTLSLHMNERGGSCFPGLTRLADESGLSRQTVVTHLDVLEASGWITKTSTGGGRGKPSGWEATTPNSVQHVDSLENCPTDGFCPSDDEKLSTSQAETVHLTERIKEEGVKRGRKERASVPRRLPESFAVTDSMRQWASEHTPLVRLDRATDAFVDYWTGAGKAKADWEATWRNWMRREQDTAEARPRVNGREPLAQQRPARKCASCNDRLSQTDTGDRCWLCRAESKAGAR